MFRLCVANHVLDSSGPSDGSPCRARQAARIVPGKADATIGERRNDRSANRPMNRQTCRTNDRRMANDDRYMAT